MKMKTKQELLEKKIGLMESKIELLSMMNYVSLDYIKLEKPNMNDKCMIVDKLDEIADLIKQVDLVMASLDSLITLREKIEFMENL